MKINMIDINKLESFKDHPFKVKDDLDMQELEQSIKNNGLLEPILVRPKTNGNYEIAEDMMFKITDNGQLMLYKNKDYEELDNNTMIVIDKEKIINPATKYPVYIEFFAIIIILSIGILALIPKKYSE